MIKFGAPALTHEMTYLPYFYYQIVAVYEDLGGDRAFVDQILANTGWDYDQLKDYYNAITNPRASGAESYDMQKFALQIIGWCEDVARLQQMSPEEYAAQSPELLQADSLLEGVIQMYLDYGGSEEELKKSEAYRSIDRERSARLYKETNQI